MVNDGSTDYPNAILNKIKDKRIKLISLNKNYGRGHARRIALKYATGDLGAVWDIDDIYFPNRFEEAVLKINKKKQYFCTPTILINNNKIVGQRGFFKPFFCKKNIFVHHTLISNLQLFRKINYESKYKCGEDFNIVYNLIHFYEGFFFKSALSAYRQDIDISTEKSIISNIAQLNQFKNSKYTGSKFSKVILWQTKINVLKLSLFFKIPFSSSLNLRPQEKKINISFENYKYLKEYLKK